MSLPAKQPRPKTCKNPACRSSFIPQRLGQAVCSPKCALATVEVQKAKEKKSLAQAGRRDIKVRKEKLKSRADHMKDTQQAFNAWIRARDAGQPCISCGTTADVQYCAGHYRTTGSCPELRFEPLNVHLQCNKNCNLSKSGNILGYRPRLLEKIGAE
ncbi:recombination protein NinG, partial [Klebsiella quasipneumoniae]|uniref:recombination protein NinG n=1 Tax=Klebsiella quasipneumoniae TaxID=1463165 RepID=UPI00164B15EF